MKRETSFYFLFVLVLFISCYLTSYILSNRIIDVNGLLATASVVVYPLTYFILILFSEKCGKEKSLILLNLSIVALMFSGLLITVASLFQTYHGIDGLEAIFNIDFRLLFATIISFYIGQILNLQIYYYLKNKKAFNFLISGVIAITVDSIILILLGYLGLKTFKEIMLLVTGQYVLSVMTILFYSICFGYLISAITDIKNKMEKEEIEKQIEQKKKEKEPKVVKKTTTKKTDASKKTPTTKKATTKTNTKKTTTKKESTKNQTKTTTKKSSK